MSHFEYRDRQLYAENAALKDVAQRFGTPFYLYSAAALRANFASMDGAFSGVDHLVCFAMKALSNLSILRLFASMGSGFDIVSGGELMRCLRAKVDPAKIVFSGVGKTDEEITAALNAGILMLNVESRPELHRISELAGRLNQTAPVSLRVNPDLDPGTHPHISTGHRTSKFGVPLKQIFEYYAEARALPNIDLVGLSTHIGSQITEATPFREAGDKLAGIIKRLKSDGIALKRLDIGGGLGISYQEEAPSPNDYAAAILKPLERIGLQIIIEPGRFLVGNAGVFVTRALYLKETDVKRFIVVDGAMNDLIRPVLYEAFHSILPVEIGGQQPAITADVVGPVCESGDFFAQEREFARPERGDLLAVMDAGAYGFVMASNYNSRPRVPELLVDRDMIHVIREREIFDDLVRGEKLLELQANGGS